MNDRKLRARVKLDRPAEGDWWMALPAALPAADLDGRPLSRAEAGGPILRLAFTVDRAQTVSVRR